VTQGVGFGDIYWQSDIIFVVSLLVINVHVLFFFSDKHERKQRGNVSEFMQGTSGPKSSLTHTHTHARMHTHTHTHTHKYCKLFTRRLFCKINTDYIFYINFLLSSKKFWEELIAYFPLIRHGPHRKRRLQQFFVAAGTSLPSCYLATIDGYVYTPTDSPWYDTDRIENDASNNSSIIARIRCRGNVFTEPLPSTEGRDKLSRAVA
jgi:hypothetical protein